MNRPGRIPLIEVLRGVAATMVALHHFPKVAHGWVYDIGTHLNLGVAIFFVISGFVIPYSLHGQFDRYSLRNFPQFMIKRMIRLEPPYLASILIVLLLNFAAANSPGFQGRPPDVATVQVLAHIAYLIPMTPYAWLQPVYWTLAFEFAFYLTMTGLIGVLVSTRALPLCACLAALLCLIALGYASPLLGLFAMGCLVFRAHTGRDTIFRSAIAIGFAGLAMGIVGAFAQALVGLLIASLILVPQSAQGAGGFVGRGLKALGAISFSLYLLHVPVGGKIVNLGQRWLSSPSEHGALSIVALAGSLLAATLFWRFIELPCMRAASGLAGYWKPVPAVSSQA